MNIRELSIAEFREFANNHFIGNIHESINYALFKAEDGYDYEFIGYGDDTLVGASLILYKKIDNYYYGYAPRGFLFDYSNLYALDDFTKKLKEYYKNKGFAFIKINPELAIAKLNKKTGNFEYNDNYRYLDNFIRCGYKKLKNNMNFESLLPRINAIVNLQDFNASVLSKNTRNKVRKGLRKGLVIEKAGQEGLDILYNFIKEKREKDSYYYKSLYNVFSKNNSVDLLLVRIDYKEFLINSQSQYNYELNRNNALNQKLLTNSNSNVINAKMNSDIALLSYKDDIAEASKYLNSGITTYVAGALVLKYNNRIVIEVSGFDKEYSRFAPNYFLYYAILNHYRQNYKYADLNGITADLSHDNYYYGLNRFKLSFNPDVYEYIGEFDLPVDEDAYNHLLKSGHLAKEFNKK